MDACRLVFKVFNIFDKRFLDSASLKKQLMLEFRKGFVKIC